MKRKQEMSLHLVSKTELTKEVEDVLKCWRVYHTVCKVRSGSTAEQRAKALKALRAVEKKLDDKQLKLYHQISGDEERAEKPHRGLHSSRRKAAF